MTEQELIEVLAERTRSNAQDVKSFISALALLAKEQVVKLGRFEIPGLLELELKIRPARSARDPRTGGIIEIPAKAHVVAHVSEYLQRVVKKETRLPEPIPSELPALEPSSVNGNGPLPTVRLSESDWNALAARELSKRNELISSLASRLDASELEGLVRRSDASNESERDLANRLLLAVWRVRGNEFSSELIERWANALGRILRDAYPMRLFDQALFEVAPQRARARLSFLKVEDLDDSGREELVRDLARLGRSEETVVKLRQIVDGGGRSGEAANRVLEGFFGIDEGVLAELSAAWKRTRSAPALHAIYSRFITHRLSHPVSKARIEEVLGEPTERADWQLVYVPSNADGTPSTGVALVLGFDGDTLSEYRMS